MTWEKQNDLEALTQALQKFNTELLAGNTWDIIDVSSFNELTSLKSYAKQGLLEDIGAWLDKDETIDTSDLISSVLEANKIDGVLYNLVPSFDIETFSSSSAIWDANIVTLRDTINYMENSTDRTLYAKHSKERFLEYIFRYNGHYLIDEETGTCRLDSEEFIDLLTYANTLPNAEEFPEYYDERGLVYKKEALLDFVTLHSSSKSYLMRTELLKSINETCTIVGFPKVSENDTVSTGSVYMNTYSFAMLSTSQHKEDAWEFFRYFLSDDYQNQLGFEYTHLSELYGIHYKPAPLFSIRQSVNQKIFNERFTGNQVECGGGWGADDPGQWEVEHEYITDEYLNTPKATLPWSNIFVYNIILEEAAFYFSGECTAEEAAKMMQSRVSLYIMEKQ